MTASAVVQSTGEVVELPAPTPEALVASLKVCNDYLDAYLQVKKQLQKQAAALIDAGQRLEHDGYLVRSYTTQRMQYDKAVLRDVFDADELDMFLEPVKGRVDAYIKEHLDELGPYSTKLRESMVPLGKPVTVVRLERTERPEA